MATIRIPDQMSIQVRDEAGVWTIAIHPLFRPGRTRVSGRQCLVTERGEAVVGLRDVTGRGECVRATLPWMDDDAIEEFFRLVDDGAARPYSREET